MFVIMVTPLPSSWPAIELTAEKAAQLVSIQWQELPVITTPEAALAEGRCTDP
ncbi:hypothetical protein ACLB1R_20495 [Escherichia coli]